MRALDHDYVDELISRLRRIEPDRRPDWGRLTAPRLIAHLIRVVRYSMGRLGVAPDQSTWFSRRVLRPLFLSGLLRLPKNVQVKRAVVDPAPDEDLETLQALLEEYLQLVQADELTPARHPLLGELGVDGWARMHVAHFEHHLRQFRA